VLQKELQHPSLDNLSINEAKILYTQYYRVYRLRVWYMKNAFKKELHDEGHKYMTENLYSYMSSLATYMENITKDYKEESEEDAKKDSEEGDEQDIKYKNKQDSNNTENIGYEETIKILDTKIIIKKQNKIKLNIETKRAECINKLREKIETERVTAISKLSCLFVEKFVRHINFETSKGIIKPFTDDSYRKHVSIKALELIVRIFHQINHGNFRKIDLSLIDNPLLVLPGLCCIKHYTSIFVKNSIMSNSICIIVAQAFIFSKHSQVYFHTHSNGLCTVKYRFTDKDFTIGTNFSNGMTSKDEDKFSTLFTINPVILNHTNTDNISDCEYCKEEIVKDLDYGVLHP